MSRRLDTRLCGPGPTSAGAGECVSTRYYIIPTPPSSHTDTDPDILYLRLLLPRAWVLSHTLTCCFWDHTGHGHCPLVCPGESCVWGFPVKNVYTAAHETDCTAGDMCTHVICHGKLSGLFLEQHRCECSLLMIKSIEIMLMAHTWGIIVIYCCDINIVHESWIKDLLPGCDCLSFQTRGDSPLWSGQWQFSKLALYCDKLGCTKCRAVAGAKLMLQLIPDHRIDRSNKKMLCFPAQKQITLPPPFVKSSWTANELLHSSRICTISV